MKQITDLTEAEIADLTPELIAYYVDLECAKSGFPLLPPKPAKPVTATFTPDTMCFGVGTSTYSMPFIFATSQDAAEVAAEINKRQRYELGYVTGWSGCRKITAEKDMVSVHTIPVFSEGGALLIKDEAEAAARIEKAYDEENREYEKALSAREKAVERVDDIIDAARGKTRRRERRRAQFERYMELAGNDRVIAVKFLLDAEPDALDLLPELADVA